MENCGKKLIGKTLLVTFFIPLIMIMLLAFEGPTLKVAVENSILSIFNFKKAIYSWILLIVFNFIILVLMKPIFYFWHKYKNSRLISLDERNRTMYVFNSLRQKITLMNVISFVIGVLGSNLSSETQNYGLFPVVYIVIEGVITGLFTSIVIIMSLDNILFPIKSALMEEPPLLKPRFTSFYRQMSLTLLLLLAFVSFQVLSVATDFYLIAFERAKELIGNNNGLKTRILSPETFISKIGQDHEAAGKLLDVLVTKIALYFLLALRVIVLLKKSIKNPLDIVEERLEQLTTGLPKKTRVIEIVDNNEFSTIFTDINKLIKKQQSELETSQKRLYNIIDNAADPIISFDDDGHIFIFNPAAERLFGWNWHDIQGNFFTDLFDQSDNYCKICGGDTKKFVHFVTDNDNKLRRYTGKTKSGEIITFEANFSSSKTSDGKIHTAIIRDISKQLEFEESLTSAKVAAENANRLKSEFLANMSHELRTPLNAVLGFTQLLSSDKNLTDSQVEKINIISRSGEHLLGLINDILDISKIEAGKIELHESTFNLHEFVEDLKQMLDLKCKKKGLALYVEYVEPLPEYIRSDLGKLRQIMINILGNAIKFTKEGGISIVVGIDNQKLKFTVNDTGKGIPENEIESILQPFTQSSITDNEGGTGLGLAITNSFINMLGGSMEIESKVDVGSTFTFSIDYEETEKIDEPDEEIGNVIGIVDDRHPSVIIVDDKVNNRLILKEMLERIGFVTIEAENGLEALDRTREFRPELVFMDIKMPVMDGYESVKLIKEDKDIKSIPVFALTASAFKHDEKSILSSGFDGFIAKPFKLNSLLKLIHDKSNIKFIYEAVKPVNRVLSVDNVDYIRVKKILTAIEIDTLDDLGIINDFTGIKNFIEQFRGNSELSDFIDTVEFYTDNFDDENLLKIIDKLKE